MKLASGVRTDGRPDGGSWQRKAEGWARKKDVVGVHDDVADCLRLAVLDRQTWNRIRTKVLPSGLDGAPDVETSISAAFRSSGEHVSKVLAQLL